MNYTDYKTAFDAWQRRAWDAYLARRDPAPVAVTQSALFVLLPSGDGGCPVLAAQARLERLDQELSAILAPELAEAWRFDSFTWDVLYPARDALAGHGKLYGSVAASIAAHCRNKSYYDSQKRLGRRIAQKLNALHHAYCDLYAAQSERLHLRAA